jgi:S-adenosylmethionine-diacylglycerol 3-amino-3-carboxypropyl transferase
MLNIKKSLNEVRDKIFTQIHSNNLIYNTCWEDPRCDRQMMHIGKTSKIVMITSAGCNALDYLLDNPSAIHCIDMNPRQNALLALKLAVFQHGTYQDLWQLFGEGHHPQAVALYAEKLRSNLPDYAQEFWDKNIIYFTKKKSFYFFGTSGTFAYWFNQYINLSSKLRKTIMELLEAKTIAEQQAIYAKVEPRIVTQFVKWMMNRHITMSMLGVPRAQRQLIVDEYPGKVAGFVQDCLRQVFTELPVSDNYFWRLYLTGKYTPACCPSYLVAENFETLKERTSQIHLHTSTMSDFLRENPDKYTQYVLLDHQDWLAAHDVPALTEEWNLILKNSKKGTKILLRSAALRVDFFPDFVEGAVEFDTEITTKLHKQDRVGTYASVYFGAVK